MPFLTPEDKKALRQELKARRTPHVLLDGRQVPGSIPYLRGLMKLAQDEFERDDLLGEIGSEYIRAGMDEEHLLVQRERVNNHPEVALMWIGLAHALERFPANAEEAKLACAKAVTFARADNALVRYALSSQAWVAQALRDREMFENAVSALIADAGVEREEDSGMFPALVDDLPEGLCSQELADAYRKVLPKNRI